jgi:hypothetical protein
MPTESRTTTRRSERKPVRIAVILLVESEGKRIESEASTLDLSQHGLRLQASVPLAQGQIVDVTTSEGPEYAVRGRVIWTGAVGSEHEGEVGFEFLSPLPMPA